MLRLFKSVRWKIDVFWPFGAHSLGSDSFENNTTEGQCDADAICMGPVSFPTAIFAFLAKPMISIRLVCPVKLMASGTMALMCSAKSLSDELPNMTGVIPFKFICADNSA